ncbi:hypothetical protein BDK51DRAFT_21883, partial [Blyttiomyces helicus]
MFVSFDLVPNPSALSVLLSFVHDIAAGYPLNPYHSFLHAADVTYVLYYALADLGELGAKLDRVEIAALLIGALSHDVLHPGLNNLYQVNAQTELAKLYNDTSVLESHSSVHVEHLLRTHSLLPLLSFGNEATTGDAPQRVQDLVVEAILFTDMSHHFALLEQLGGLVESALKRRGPRRGRERMVNILLHGADISNAARPFEICRRWSDMVVEEFFMQGEQEKRMNLPVSPNMDRQTTNPTQTALDFNEYLVHPYFSLLTDLLPSLEPFCTLLVENSREWK